MKRILSLAAAILFPLSLSAQTPGPGPTPPPADEADVVKITTALIQLDVTVTDRNGKIVTDLQPGEIEIYENGQKQKVTNFSFVSNLRTVDKQTKPKRDKDDVILPGTPVRQESVRRTIALVVDDLTLSFESTYFVRRALKKFVDEQMETGDLVAIIRTGAGIGALQQFTNDKRQLHAAIEKVRWNALGSGNIGAFAPLDARIASEDDEANEENGPRRIRSGEGIDQEFRDFRESLFATGTLGAINYVIRGMQGLPGRKSVMLLSDGFSLFTRDAQGFTQTDRVLAALRRLVDLANRSAVVVYTMDARGLQYTGLTAADDTSGRTQEQLERDLTDRRSRLFDTQQGLQYLARQTGGIAIVNNNDLSGGIRRVLDDQSYYLIGYEPNDETFDPKVRRFNRIEVKVTRPNAKVRYRSGFFGVSDDRLVRPAETGPERLMTALTSPFAAEGIALRLNALYYNSPKDGDVIRSLVHIRAQDISFTETADGNKRAVFDVLAAGFGDNGVLVDQISKTYTMTLKPDAYKRFMERGFVYDFSFPIKKPGAYQLRIALRDSTSDKVGSANQFVEVPSLKKGRLQLSGMVLENLSLADWNKRQAGQQISDQSKSPLMDTSLRQFKRGTVLAFGFSVYNARLTPAPSLSSRTRLYRDGKLVFEGNLQPISGGLRSGQKSIDFSSALSLGSELPPGDYILQISIIDNLAKPKKNTATQFVQFEVLE